MKQHIDCVNGAGSENHGENVNFACNSTTYPDPERRVWKQMCSALLSPHTHYLTRRCGKADRCRMRVPLLVAVSVQCWTFTNILQRGEDRYNACYSKGTRKSLVLLTMVINCTTLAIVLFALKQTRSTETGRSFSERRPCTVVALLKARIMTGTWSFLNRAKSCHASVQEYSKALATLECKHDLQHCKQQYHSSGLPNLGSAD